jgi:hypothetical protein
LICSTVTGAEIAIRPLKNRRKYSARINWTAMDELKDKRVKIVSLKATRGSKDIRGSQKFSLNA